MNARLEQNGEVETGAELGSFVEDLYLLLQQCLQEEEENKVIRKVDRKKTKQIQRGHENMRVEVRRGRVEGQRA